MANPEKIKTCHFKAEYYLRNLLDFNEVLEVAMQVNTAEAARDLLDVEAIPRGRDVNSALLLTRVLRCYVGHTATLQEVVGEGARQRGLRSLLHVSSTEGHAGIVRLLLQWGADPSEYDELRRSALHMAAAHGHRAVVQILLEHGADVRAIHCSGKTALHFAAEGSDDDELVAMLLDRGLDVNGRDRIHRSTPLHLAAWKGRWKVVRLLLERGADLSLTNGQGCTPVHLGARCIQVLELLLERGGDLKRLDARGYTPLRWLDEHKFSEAKTIISRLVKNEARGILIDKENANCIENDPLWKFIKNDCAEEIMMMKNTKCYRKMTCFDLLALSLTELAMRMRNRRLSHFLRHLYFDEQFFIYCYELKEKVIKAHEHKAHLHRVAHFVQRSFGDRLPFTVTSKIGEYLAPKDIRFR